MKKSYPLLILAMLIVFAFQSLAQPYTLYPGVTEISRRYEAPFVTTPPVIDGDIDDPAWALAPWAQAQSVSGLIDAGGTEFSGAADCGFKYKIVWDNTTYYMLMRYHDDVEIYGDYHFGYPGRGNIKPPFDDGRAYPSGNNNTGTFDGTAFQNWRMDQIAWWITKYDTRWLSAYVRNNNGLQHTFYPAQIKSTQAGSVLWSAKYEGGQFHKAKAAAKYNETEGAYYIEFRDTTWATLFTLVKTNNQATTQSFPELDGYVPAVGDTFMLAGEINDADVNTNLRDYRIELASESTTSNSILSEAVIVKLVSGSTSVGEVPSLSKFSIYPNPNSTSILRLNRSADVEIFNLAGQRVIQSINTSEVNISGLQPGVYMVKDKEGNVRKLVRK
jgi:hypothetical protein